MVVLTAGMLAMAIIGTTRAEIVSVNFDGTGYIAGTQPPLPWSNEWDDTTHTVEASIGYLATQGLVVRSSRGVVYDFPTPLTSDMGAVSVSILFNPQGFPSSYNFGAEGGVQIGWGSKKLGEGDLRGVIFQHVSGIAGIYGPGSGYGTRMGSFSPYQWYQITFNIDPDWQSMNISAGPLGQAPVSMTSTWSGEPITRIWTTEKQAPNPLAYYDNLYVTAVVICPSADLTDDCFVNMKDIAFLANYWLDDNCTSPGWCDGADLDTSGKVDFADLEDILDEWLNGTPND